MGEWVYFLYGKIKNGNQVMDELKENNEGVVRKYSSVPELLTFVVSVLFSGAAKKTLGF